MSNEEQQQIMDLLKARGVGDTCPRCSRNQWTFGSNYLATPALADFKAAVSVARKSDFAISVTLICKNCGFVSEHSAKILGLV
jgi:hypothetical protein